MVLSKNLFLYIVLILSLSGCNYMRFCQKAEKKSKELENLMNYIISNNLHENFKNSPFFIEKSKINDVRSQKCIKQLGIDILYVDNDEKDINIIKLINYKGVFGAGKQIVFVFSKNSNIYNRKSYPREFLFETEGYLVFCFG